MTKLLLQIQSGFMLQKHENLFKFREMRKSWKFQENQSKSVKVWKNPHESSQKYISKVYKKYLKMALFMNFP